MSEAKMYAISRTSYEDIDKARLVLKHRQSKAPVPGARTQHVEAIYIESENGERYKIHEISLMVQEHWHNT